MAIRSGGGTGVLVALVVFVLTTVFLLVMTIVFYAGKNEAVTRANDAEATLETFINRAQEQSDEVKTLRTQANAARQSLYGFLQGQRGELATWLGLTDRTATLESMQADFGVGKDQTVKGVLTDLRRQLKGKTDEANNMATRLGDLNKQVTALKDEVESTRTDGQKSVAAIGSEFAGYVKAADELKAQVTQARSTIEQTKDEREAKHRNREQELQTEIDTLRSQMSLLESRNQALQAKVETIELKPQNPAELVDGRIVAVEGSGDTVFLSIGARDRVVPGMTFEVFDDANAIRAAGERGNARGKGTVQVLRVGDTTSTAKVIRQSPARPVIKDDVIANAVFNPNYQFKFLVHGKFDVDGDGRPSDSEADYLRSRIVEWGGLVVDAEELSGDLDFVVLGIQPPMPAALPSDAPEATVLQAMEARTARETYDRLFRQATDARIPVLNWNRFQILTGATAGR
jgi:hypothetical protein